MLLHRRVSDLEQPDRGHTRNRVGPHSPRVVALRRRLRQREREWARGSEGGAGVSAVVSASGFRLVFQLLCVVTHPHLHHVAIAQDNANILHSTSEGERGACAGSGVARRASGARVPWHPAAGVIRCVCACASSGAVRRPGIQRAPLCAKPSSAFALITLRSAHRVRRGPRHTHASAAARRDAAGSAAATPQGHSGRSTTALDGAGTCAPAIWRTRQVAPPRHLLPRSRARVACCLGEGLSLTASVRRQRRSAHRAVGAGKQSVSHARSAAPGRGMHTGRAAPDRELVVVIATPTRQAPSLEQATQKQKSDRTSAHPCPHNDDTWRTRSRTSPDRKATCLTCQEA